MKRPSSSLHSKSGKSTTQRQVAQAELAAHFEAELAKLLAGLHDVVAAENQDKVAGLGVEGGLHLLEDVLGVELVDARLDVAVGFDAGVDQTLGADLRALDEVGELVELLAGVGGGSGGADAADVGRVVEHCEAVALEDVHQFDELHSEAQVGLVAAVEAHGVAPGHLHEGLGEFDAADGFEQMLGHAFEEADDVLLLHEAHLAVDLGEFGLTVGAEVFVAEALDYLEVTVESGHHQQLLEHLRALRQGVELARVHARGHHKVARAFGRGADEHGRLYFDEVHRVEIAAYFHRHAVAQQQIVADAAAAQVEVAVFHADVIAAVGVVFDGEGRHFGRVEHREPADGYFDVAGGELGVLAGALNHFAVDLNHIFAAERIGLLAECRIVFRIECQLGYAVAVAQIDKRHSAKFSNALHPAAECYFGSGVRQTQLAASVCPVHNIA